MLDGLSHQSMLDAHGGTTGSLRRGFYKPLSLHYSLLSGILPQVSRTRFLTPEYHALSTSLSAPQEWPASIDREYWTLRKRKSWICVPGTSGMVIVPYTSVFKLKKLDDTATKFLEKSRCCICRNRQTPELDFDPPHGFCCRHVTRACSLPTLCRCSTWPHRRRRGYQ